MDLLNICDMLLIKATFRSWWMCGCPRLERNYTLVKEGEKIGWIKKKNINGGVIYVAGSNHTRSTSSHHTLHGHIHEVRVRLKSMMQCPHILRACWKHDSWVQSLTQVCLFCACITAVPWKHRKSLLQRTYLFKSLQNVINLYLSCLVLKRKTVNHRAECQFFEVCCKAFQGYYMTRYFSK